MYESHTKIVISVVQYATIKPQIKYIYKPQNTSAISQNIIILTIFYVTWTTAAAPQGARQLASYVNVNGALNHTHKFIFMNQNGKILSRRTHETKHQIGMA